MNGLMPWQVHAGLTEERLGFVAGVIRDVRLDALSDHDPDKGDTGWSLGCRAYERICFALTQAAESNEWLRIIPSDRHFVFSIDGVPMRFYRGAPNEPQARWLRRGYPEIRQQVLAFASSEFEGWMWRAIVETGPDGSVLRVVFAEMTEEGHVRNQWEAPLEGRVSTLTAMTPRRAEPVELDAPAVGPKLDEKKISSNE